MSSSKNTKAKGKGKKVINQDELRRLMREKQRQTTDKKKRIESPFAKYNSLDHLSCVLCNVQVKSDILWQTHILGKQHKEKVAELKGNKQGPSQSSSQTAQPTLLKRKALEHVNAEGKKSKSSTDTSGSSAGLPADFFEGDQKASSSRKPSGLGILAGTYDDDNDNKEDEEISEANGGQAITTDNSLAQKGAPDPGLPADFFESIPGVPSVSHSGSIFKADEPEKIVEKRENTAEALPEGFFDDPVRDAKVRNVDAPKDQMDKEWEEFQKEMRQVNNASDAIVAEDDEEGRFERQIDEIDEQIECYRRVEVLRNKQEVVKGVTTKEKTQMPEELSEESDEEDDEELLHLLSRDWRAKGAIA